MCNQGKPLWRRGSNAQAVPTFLIWVLDEIRLMRLKSASRKCAAEENCVRPDLLEPRFWLGTELPTIKSGSSGFTRSNIPYDLLC
jgi:hypothetical protein